tara:strand:- start:43087 stop:44160 length:1074 start_codon:yes stop_codon:yes gene_type:complete
MSCEPLVNTFENVENAELYRANVITVPAVVPDTLKVMTWNIRFGAGRIPWFGDGCGDRVILTESEVMSGLNSIATFINSENLDIILLQEVDVFSKRTAYVDQVQWLLDNTGFNYGAFASMWEAQVIPSDGLGRVNTGNAILSKWNITDAERIQLPLRGDQEGLVQYFFLRRNILKAKINVSAENDFYAVNIHATAFATDDTKQKHIDKFKVTLAELNDMETFFVAGGDLNSIPPNASFFDFCEIDKCAGEIVHTEADGGPHLNGSYFNNFNGEQTLLQPLYEVYFPAVDISYEHGSEDSSYTHTTWNTAEETERDWDRKLDYLFSNKSWVVESGESHQDAFYLSDHAPVSAKIETLE